MRFRPSISWRRHFWYRPKNGVASWYLTKNALHWHVDRLRRVVFTGRCQMNDCRREELEIGKLHFIRLQSAHPHHSCDAQQFWRSGYPPTWWTVWNFTLIGREVHVVLLEQSSNAFIGNRSRPCACITCITWSGFDVCGHVAKNRDRKSRGELMRIRNPSVLPTGIALGSITHWVRTPTRPNGHKWLLCMPWSAQLRIAFKSHFGESALAVGLTST